MPIAIDGKRAGGWYRLSTVVIAVAEPSTTALAHILLIAGVVPISRQKELMA